MTPAHEFIVVDNANQGLVEKSAIAYILPVPVSISPGNCGFKFFENILIPLRQVSSLYSVFVTFSHPQHQK